MQFNSQSRRRSAWGDLRIMQFNSQSQHRFAPVALRTSPQPQQQHHSAQGIFNNTDNQQRSQNEATLRLRGMRPMGRSSKDTMESPYSARLPSSLSWRQNREDTSSSGNGRWAAPVSLAATSQSGSRFVLSPLRTCPAVTSGMKIRLDPSADRHPAARWSSETVQKFAERPERSEVAIAGNSGRENSQSDPSAAKLRLRETAGARIRRATRAQRSCDCGERCV